MSKSTAFDKLTLTTSMAAKKVSTQKKKSLGLPSSSLGIDDLPTAHDDIRSRQPLKKVFP
jgi:hypothetical protein